MGTITADGKADVFSYAEDNMVSDPHLAKHLLHFGIQINQLSKTDKSMAEIEIDMNQRIGEWAVLTEAGSKLVPVYGAGYTGMENLGNTCYMNSVMQVGSEYSFNFRLGSLLKSFSFLCRQSFQVLLSLPPFKSAYVDGAPNYFSKVNFGDPGSDFKLQMCKLASSLW